ncbi:MAG: transposase family protein [Bacteroidota bacterium]
MEQIIIEYQDLNDQIVNDPFLLQEEKKEEEEKELPDVLTYNRLNPDELKLMTGFLPDEFDELVELLIVPLTPPAVGNKGRRPKLLATPQDRLLALLVWFRFYDQWSRMGAIFGVSKTHIHHIVHALLDKVATVLKDLFIVPISHKEQADAKALFPNFPQVSAVTDSTVQRTSKPVGSFDEARKHWYAKAKVYGIKSLTFHACNGALVAAFPGHPAAISDVTLFRKPEVLSEVRLIVAKAPGEGPADELYPEWAIMADLGFQGIQYNVRAVLPNKKRPHTELLSAEKAHNTRLAKRRIIIENFYGRLKRKFRIMNACFTHNKDVYPLVFICCVSLINFDISRRPLRRSEAEF